MCVGEILVYRVAFALAGTFVGDVPPGSTSEVEDRCCPLLLIFPVTTRGQQPIV